MCVYVCAHACASQVFLNVTIPIPVQSSRDPKQTDGALGWDIRTLQDWAPGALWPLCDTGDTFVAVPELGGEGTSRSGEIRVARGLLTLSSQLGCLEAT